MTDDLLKRAEPFLNQCGICDYGVLVPCTCPKPDYRPVMLDLVREVERLRANHAEGAYPLPALLSIVANALRNGSYMTKANWAFIELCDQLGFDDEQLPPFDTQWPQGLVRR